MTINCREHFLTVVASYCGLAGIAVRRAAQFECASASQWSAHQQFLTWPHPHHRHGRNEGQRPLSPQKGLSRVSEDPEGRRQHGDLAAEEEPNTNKDPEGFPQPSWDPSADGLLPAAGREGELGIYSPHFRDFLTRISDFFLLGCGHTHNPCHFYHSKPQHNHTYHLQIRSCIFAWLLSYWLKSEEWANRESIHCIYIVLHPFVVAVTWYGVKWNQNVMTTNCEAFVYIARRTIQWHLMSLNSENSTF